MDIVLISMLQRFNCTMNMNYVVKFYRLNHHLSTNKKTTQFFEWLCFIKYIFIYIISQSFTQRTENPLVFL